MAERKKSKSQSAAYPRVAVIFSAYNATITHNLLMGACEALVEATGQFPDVYEAPGAYELTTLSMTAARGGKYDGIVALGCIIKGETTHDQHIASAVAHGLTNVTLLTDVPVAFGVLTTNNVAQARARAGLTSSGSNKGYEAMRALLATLDANQAVAAALPGTVFAPSGGSLPDKAAGGKAAKVKSKSINISNKRASKSGGAR